jgi:hypothetical protein
VVCLIKMSGPISFLIKRAFETRSNIHADRKIEGAHLHCGWDATVPNPRWRDPATVSVIKI